LLSPEKRRPNKNTSKLGAPMPNARPTRAAFTKKCQFLVPDELIELRQGARMLASMTPCAVLARAMWFFGW
jgi:hypothetical protein